MSGQVDAAVLRLNTTAAVARAKPQAVADARSEGRKLPGPEMRLMEWGVTVLPEAARQAPASDLAAATAASLEAAACRETSPERRKKIVKRESPRDVADYGANWQHTVGNGHNLDTQGPCCLTERRQRSASRQSHRNARKKLGKRVLTQKT